MNIVESPPVKAGKSCRPVSWNHFSPPEKTSETWLKMFLSHLKTHTVEKSQTPPSSWESSLVLENSVKRSNILYFPNNEFIMRAFLTSPRSSVSSWPSPRWPTPVSVQNWLPISNDFWSERNATIAILNQPWRAQAKKYSGGWARPTSLFNRYADSDQSSQDRGGEIVHI